MTTFAAIVALLLLAARLGGADEPPPRDEPRAVHVQHLTVESDYGQIYLYDSNAFIGGPQTEDDNSYLRSLDDGSNSRRFVGYDRGFVNILTPSQYNWKAPLTIEIYDDRPPATLDRWDHVVEVPLPSPSGALVFEASGGGTPVEAKIPPGQYRARISGRGFVAGIGEIEGREEWRLQLWPAPESEPTLLKYWDGWDFMRPREEGESR